MSYSIQAIAPALKCLKVGTNLIYILQTYDLGTIPPLLATIRQLFELYPRIEVLISATVRNEETLKRFTEGCSKSIPAIPVTPASSSSVGSNRFELTLIEFDCPPSVSQIGFFHPTRTPIRIYSITMHISVKDPFAVSDR